MTKNKGDSFYSIATAVVVALVLIVALAMTAENFWASSHPQDEAVKELLEKVTR